LGEIFRTCPQRP